MRVFLDEGREIDAEPGFGEAAGEEDLFNGIFMKNSSDLFVFVDDGGQIGIRVGAGFALALEDDVGDGDP